MLPIHPHSAWPETTWHCEFGPHGFGVHGLGGMGRKVPSSTTGLGMAANKFKICIEKLSAHFLIFRIGE